MIDATAAPGIREAGDAAWLVVFAPMIDPAVHARVVALAARVREAALPGVRDVVPAFRSVGLFFDPRATDLDALRALVVAPLPASDARPAREHLVPVAYGGAWGPDLDEVAAASGLTTDEVVRRHAAASYRVYMLGFLPGFGYLGTLDAAIVARRRPVPRVRIPAGAVAVAGRQTGVYPRESPGGWQLIGRTPLSMFDLSAPTHAARLAPGDTVRFVPTPADAIAWPADEPGRASATGPVVDAGTGGVTVLAPGLLTTVQDAGRWGHQHEGVGVAGPLDAVAHARANAAVGNDPAAAALEATIVGPTLRLDEETTLALSGADLGATVGGVPVPPDTAVRCAAGATLAFGARRAGARTAIAFAGGIDLPPVLGSRATHVASALGGLDGRPLRAGDRLRLDTAGATVHPRPLHAHAPGATPLPAGGARLRVVPGPHDDWFAPESLAALWRTRFTIAAQSNRMGYRLTGGTVTPRAGELISDVTFPGSIQVPPSGEPILLLADRQTTGGYPQAGVVVTADLPLAGQLAPGDWVEFEPCGAAEARGWLHG